MGGGHKIQIDFSQVGMCVIDRMVLFVGILTVEFLLFPLLVGTLLKIIRMTFSL